MFSSNQLPVACDQVSAFSLSLFFFFFFFFSGIDPTGHHGQKEGHQEVPGRHLHQREDHCGGARCRINVHVLFWPINLPSFPTNLSSDSLFDSLGCRSDWNELRQHFVSRYSVIVLSRFCLSFMKNLNQNGQNKMGMKLKSKSQKAVSSCLFCLFFITAKHMVKGQVL